MNSNIDMDMINQMTAQRAESFAKKQEKFAKAFAREQEKAAKAFAKEQEKAAKAFAKVQQKAAKEFAQNQELDRAEEASEAEIASKAAIWFGSSRVFSTNSGNSCYFHSSVGNTTAADETDAWLASMYIKDPASGCYLRGGPYTPPGEEETVKKLSKSEETDAWLASMYIKDPASGCYLRGGPYTPPAEGLI